MEEQEAETEGDSIHQGKTTPKSMAPVTPTSFFPQQFYQLQSCGWKPIHWLGLSAPKLNWIISYCL